MAGFHFSYIGGVERAEKNITLLNLQKIADALQVNVHELFVYSKYVKTRTNDKEKLLNEINEKLWPMKSSDLKRLTCSYLNFSIVNTKNQCPLTSVFCVSNLFLPLCLTLYVNPRVSVILLYMSLHHIALAF